jgi:hypothetical protein
VEKGTALADTFRTSVDPPAPVGTVENDSAIGPGRPLLEPPPRETWGIVLLGGPGSGKGTQAEILSAALRLPHIATGELFREHLRRATTYRRAGVLREVAGEGGVDAVAERVLAAVRDLGTPASAPGRPRAPV